MQFVLLIYQGTTPLPTSKDAWGTLSEDEQKAIYSDYEAINRTEGVTPGPPLGLPQSATTVRVQDGTTVTSNGPFIDAHGAVGGFLVLEAEDIDAAIMLASRIPATRHGGAIEVRPVSKYW